MGPGGNRANRNRVFIKIIEWRAPTEALPKFLVTHSYLFIILECYQRMFTGVQGWGNGSPYIFKLIMMHNGWLKKFILLVKPLVAETCPELLSG